MTRTKHKHHPEHLYTTHRGLIHNKATSHHRRFGIPLEDLLSEAHLIFVRAAGSWKPGLSGFGTWLTIKLENGLLGYALREKRRTEREVQMELLPANAKSAPDLRLQMKELLVGLSTEAQYVAGLVLNGPAEVLELLGTESATAVRGALKRHLRQQNWSWATIWRTFKELKCAVGRM